MKKIRVSRKRHGSNEKGVLATQIRLAIQTEVEKKKFFVKKSNSEGEMSYFKFFFSIFYLFVLKKYLDQGISPNIKLRSPESDVEVPSRVLQILKNITKKGTQQPLYKVSSQSFNKKA